MPSGTEDLTDLEIVLIAVLAVGGSSGASLLVVCCCCRKRVGVILCCGKSGHATKGRTESFDLEMADRDEVKSLRRQRAERVAAALHLGASSGTDGRISGGNMKALTRN